MARRSARMGNGVRIGLRSVSDPNSWILRMSPMISVIAVQSSAARMVDNSSFPSILIMSELQG
jgi:hypothetical protein